LTIVFNNGSADSGRFVILGGGPCGLAAAWKLAKLGHAPIVLEREPLVGGLCATHERDGFRFDLGGHRFVSSDADLSRWLEQLLGDDLLTRERRSVVLHEGRAFRYPIEAADLVRNLGVAENARALAGYARERVAHAIHPRPERSFEDWVVARFGRPLYETFFGPYTQKLWGISPRLISADWAAERITLLNLGDAALRLVGVPRPPIRTYARRYLYPRFGMGQLYVSMAREVTRLGGDIRTHARVVGLDVAPGAERSRVSAVHVRTRSGTERIPVREVFSTLPLTELVSFLRAPGSSAPGVTERSAGAGLRFRSLVFLNLSLRRTDFSDNTWMYVASGKLRISRIQEPKRRSPSMVPDERTSIMLEIPCDAGDAIWSASDPELLELAQRELGALGLALDDVVGSFSVRVEHGYPIYHLDYERDRQALLRQVDRFANLRTGGRQGLFRYVFMDTAMQMGILAAEEMASGTRPTRTIDALGRRGGLVESQALTA
jgi:protoporphyrinogen oxidase